MFSREQINSLAPDNASLKAAEKLLSTNKWPLLQYNDIAIWGECQGSGASPYQSRIDLNGPAFKCSCPSRKFPCKHGLALFLLYAERKASFIESDTPPPWVSEWLDSRADKALKKIETTAAPKPVDEVAQARRVEKRQQNIEQGLVELQRWLEDVARVGMTDLQGKNYSYWDHLSARLIDAQASGLAFRVRQLGEQVMKSAPHIQLTAHFAEIALLVEAALRQETLPPLLQQDIRGFLGWTQTQDDLLLEPAIADQWWVWSHQLQQEDKLIRQDIILQGCQNRHFARVIQYAHTTQRNSLVQGWLPGHRYQANAHFYPGTFPLRAIVVNPSHVPSADSPSHLFSMSNMVEHYQQQLLQQPWLAERPYVLEKVIPRITGVHVFLHGDDTAIIASLSTQAKWQLLALSGGGPVTLFGEWNGELFHPRSVVAERKFFTLDTTLLGEA